MKNLLGFVVAAGILVAIATTVITAQSGWITTLYDWAKKEMGVTGATCVTMMHIQ